MLFRPKNPITYREKIRNFLWPRRGLRRSWTYIWHRVTRLSGSPHAIAIGFAAGAFASITPFVGFHFILAAILALIVGGNILASALGTSVGNPLSFPFIWLGTYNVGAYLLGYERAGQVTITFPDGLMLMLLREPVKFWEAFWQAMSPVFLPMLVGSVPLGLFCAVLTYFIVAPTVRGYQHRRQARLTRPSEDQ